MLLGANTDKEFLHNLLSKTFNALFSPVYTQLLPNIKSEDLFLEVC